jgi:hypothetical protein
VNDWSDDEVEEHLRLTAKIWRQREEIEDWGLDLAALGEYGMAPPPLMDAQARHDTRGARRLRARRDVQVARERALADLDAPEGDHRPAG